MMYANLHFDPVAEVKEDRNGIGCPHCKQRFLQTEQWSFHLKLHELRGADDVFADLTQSTVRRVNA